MATRAIDNTWSEINTHISELANQRRLQGWEAFRDWAFAEIFRGEALSENISEIDLSSEHTRIDGPDDLEIDGFLVNEDDRLVSLFQAKDRPRISRKLLETFLTAPNRVLNADLVNTCNNSEVKYLHSVLRDKLPNESYGLSLVFVTSGRLDARANALVKDFQNQKRIHLQILERDLPVQTELQVYDRADFADLYNRRKAERRSSQPPYVELPLVRHYEFISGGINTISALIPARDLVVAFRKYEYQLFDQNPRLWLGTRARPYIRMADTIADKAKKARFHLLNNGLSVLCDNYDPVDTSDPERPIYGFWNFQVVNGCQTTVFLYKNSDKIDDQVFVSLKVTKTDEGELGQQIAEATNTQTGLKAQQFKANEDQQRQLKDEFQKLSWFYEIKTGEWAHDTPDKHAFDDKSGKHRYLNMKDVAQSALAFIGMPGEAVEDTKTIFENKENEDRRRHYEDVYPSGISAEQLLLPSLIRQKAAAIIKGYDPAQRDPFNYGELYIVWLIGDILRSHYVSQDAGYLSKADSLELRQSMDDWFDDLFEVATETLSDVVEEVKEDHVNEGSTFNQRNFYRSISDSANFNRVKVRLERVLQRIRRRPRREDPLGSLPS